MEGELHKTTRAYCTKCYWGSRNSFYGHVPCSYYYYTGKSRVDDGCPEEKRIGYCNKFFKGHRPPDRNVMDECANKAYVVGRYEDLKEKREARKNGKNKH